jgi:hypothetical protein
VTSEAVLHRQQEHPKHRLVGRAPAGHLQGGRPAFRRRLDGGSGFAAAKILRYLVVNAPEGTTARRSTNK